MAQAVYFITFTTYGSLLPGDARIATRAPDARGRPVRVPFAPMLRAAILRTMREPRWILRFSQRLAVRRSIAETCALAAWPLVTLTVEPTHVHLVVASVVAGERVARMIKARATNALRHLGRSDGREHLWTRGSSARRLESMTAILRAIAYVNAHPHAYE